jgi:hypothetical protein
MAPLFVILHLTCLNITCNTHGGWIKCVSWWPSFVIRDHFKGRDTNRTIILNWMSYKCELDLDRTAQNYWVYSTFPSSGIVENIEQDFSEKWICFRPQVKGRRHILSWDLVQWLRFVFSLFTWGWKHIQFPKRGVFYSLEYRTMEKGKKSSNSVLYKYTIVRNH